MHTAAALALACAGWSACGGGHTGPKPPLSGEGKPAPPAKLEDLRGQLVAISVVGLAADREAAARAALQSAVGAPFDQSRVATDIQAIWRLGSIADVRADARRERGGVALRYTVREHPRIRTLDVRGSKAIPAAQWLAQMPVKGGDFFDPMRLSAIRNDMADRLRQLGFHTAKVDWTTAATQGGGVDVSFVVEQGRIVSVAALEVRGNKVAPRKTLLDLLAQGGGTAVGARYWRQGFQEGLAQINAYYQDRGFIDVAIGPIEEKLSPDGGAMSLAITVQEGNQYRLGELSFQGGLLATQREYAVAFGMRRGNIFSRRKIAEGMDRLRELHRNKGKPNVNMIPVTELEASKKRVKVTIQVVSPPKGQVARPAPAPAAPGGAPAPTPAPNPPAPRPPSAATPPPATTPPPAAATPPPATPPPPSGSPGPGRR